MAEATLMATSRLCLASFHPEQHGKAGLKDLQAVKFCDTSVLEVPGIDGLHLLSNQLDVSRNAPTLPRGFNQPFRQSLSTYNSVLANVQGSSLDSVLLSFTIAEKYERHEKMLHLLSSGSSVLVGGDLSVPVPNDLMGLHTLSVDINSPQVNDITNSSLFYDSGDNLPGPFLYPCKEFYSLKNLTENVPELSFDPLAMANRNDDVLLTGNEIEVKHLLTMLKNVYFAKKVLNGLQRREMVVPYFRRSVRKARSNTQGHLNVKEVAASTKSPEEINLGSLPKKKQKKKFGNEKMLYKDNYSLVCESLLSVVLFKDPDKTALISLKRNSRELTQVLTQFSASIAGTGLAVLFSVIWKLGGGRVQFCTTRLLNTGFALGLLWLSSSVNSLRDTILETTKSPGNMKSREGDITPKLERSVKEVFLRVAAVVAIVIVRLA